MSSVGAESRVASTVADRLRTLVCGADAPRVRATWRVLLAWPVLWVLTGGVLTGNLQATVSAIPSGGGPTAGLVQSLLHAGFFALALVAWARYLDRRPLSEYGIAPSRRWVGDLLVGFVAVLLGSVAWLALGAVLGGRSVELAASNPDGSLLGWMAVVLVAFVLHAAVQQVVFFRVVLGSAVEGLDSRGVEPTRAAAAAALVAVALFVAMHGVPTGLRVLDLAVAGGVFALLAIHTRELGVGIGAHLGALFGGSVLFVPASVAAGGPAVFRVSGSLPGILGVVGQYGFPKMVLASLLLVAWLRRRRGGVRLEAGAGHLAEQ